MSLDSSPIVFDLETSVIAGAADFIPKKKAPKSYKKDEAIAEFEMAAVTRELENAALDIDLCRIVAVAWMEPGMTAPAAYAAKNEDDERKLLKAFTRQLREGKGHATKTIVGFNVLDFDLLAYQRRCLYLNVEPAYIQVDRYRHPRVVDLMQELSYNGRKTYRSLDFYCRRFGINVPDQWSGSDVPRLAAEKNYQAIIDHCKADVVKEWQLAVRLGVIDTPVVAAPFFDQMPF